MKHLVEFNLENGGTVLMEAEDSDFEEQIICASPQLAPREVTKISNKTFEESLEVIKPAAETLLNKLTGMCNKPEEIKVSFGISMDLKAGMFISANTSSTFNVTLK